MRIPNWFKVEAGGLRFYQAWNLQATELARHGFSTRGGGVSEPPFDTLNLGLGTDDEPERVIENRRRFGTALGLDAERIAVPQQVHSATVRRVGASDAGSGALDFGTSIPETDALITNVPGLTLALHFADCVCIFLLDPENKAIGAVHAGWRGTAARVATAAVEAMTREFGTDPKKLLGAIGPAVERHCYDVDQEVALQFTKVFPHDERVCKQSSMAKWRVDLKTANLVLLTRAGLDENNIAVSELCTCCEVEEFFSYRRDGGTGRMSGWISLA